MLEKIAPDLTFLHTAALLVVFLKKKIQILFLSLKMGAKSWFFLKSSQNHDFFFKTCSKSKLIFFCLKWSNTAQKFFWKNKKIQSLTFILEQCLLKIVQNDFKINLNQKLNSLNFNNILDRKKIVTFFKEGKWGIN